MNRPDREGGVPYRGCVLGDGDGSSLRDATWWSLTLGLLVAAALVYLFHYHLH